MTLLSLENVERTYGDWTVFSGIGLMVGEGDKIGVVGDNGAGKSTLIKIIAGVDAPDRGLRRPRRGLQIAYGAQLPELPKGATVLQAVLGALDRVNTMERRLREIEEELVTTPDSVALHEEYDALHVAFDAAGGFERERFARTTLMGLGFSEAELERPVEVLSGGQQSRLVLASLMLAPAEVLILDEPTNHLDLAGIDFLEEFLRARPGAVIVVSHDRRFLDAVATSILEVEDGRVTRYRGNYSSYREQKALAQKTQLREYEKQREFIEKEMDYIRRNMGSRHTDQAKGRLKRLMRMEVIARPRESRKELRLRLGKARGYEGQVLLELQKVAFEYPGRPVFRNLNLELHNGEVLGIVGENGAGKTTLLDLMLGRLAPTAGTLRRPARALPGYFGQHVEELPEGMTVLKAVQQKAPLKSEGELRDYLALFLFVGDDVEQEVQTLSGGERRRLSLARLLLAGFDFLLMDEPTNHLDITAREGLEQALQAYAGGVAVVSHDREFLARVADRILFVAGTRTRLFENGWEEFAAFRAQERAAQRAQKAEARRERQDLKAAEAPKTAEPAIKSGKVRNPMQFQKLEEQIFAKEEELTRVRAAQGLEDNWKFPDKLKELKRQEEALGAELAELYQRWENWQ